MPLTGAILVFEISRNYDLILPLMFGAIFSTFIVQRAKVRTFNPLDKPLIDAGFSEPSHDNLPLAQKK